MAKKLCVGPWPLNVSMKLAQNPILSLVKSLTFLWRMLQIPLSLVLPWVPKEVLPGATMHLNYHPHGSICLWVSCQAANLLPELSWAQDGKWQVERNAPGIIKAPFELPTILWFNLVIVWLLAKTIFGLPSRKRTPTYVNRIKGQQLDSSFNGWKTVPELCLNFFHRISVTT